MSVGNGNRKRIGGVAAVGRSARQQAPHHGADLAFVAMTCADYGLLHCVRRVFGNEQSRKRRYDQRDATRLAELQRRRSVAIDEGLFDRGLYRRKLCQDLGQPVENLAQPRAKALRFVRHHRPAGDEAQSRTIAVDNPPAGPSQAWVDADDANRAVPLG